MSAVLGILPIVAIGLVVGILIGCIGIGGVLLVPSLTYVGGMDVHVAIASCMLSYLFSGAVGALEYARRGTIRWSMSGWLCLGAMPGAYLGALTVSVLSGRLLELLIGVLIVLSGVHALLRRPEPEGSGAALGGAALALVGGVTGFGSAMSGTGGPLILVPILVWLGTPVLTAVGLSQVIQLPVAALATAGNVAHGQVDVLVGGGVAALLVAGVVLGARLAHRVPSSTLRRAVAVVLIGVGALVWARVVSAGWG